jgi:hypothetical protein
MENEWNEEVIGHPVSSKFHEEIQFLYKEIINRSIIIKLMENNSITLWSKNALINVDDYAAIIAFQTLFPNLYDANMQSEVVEITTTNPPKPSDYAFQLAAYFKAYHSVKYGHIFRRLLDRTYLGNLIRTREQYNIWQSISIQQQKQPQQGKQYMYNGSPTLSQNPSFSEYQLQQKDRNWENLYLQDPSSGYTQAEHDEYIKKTNNASDNGTMKKLEKPHVVLEEVERTIPRGQGVTWNHIH